MSQFSKQLEAYIMQRGVNYVQLARRTGIDRTLLHHLVRGDRRPSGPEQVERLADALSLSPAERKEFVRLGRIARIGEEVYGRRLAVPGYAAAGVPDGAAAPGTRRGAEGNAPSSGMPGGRPGPCAAETAD